MTILATIWVYVKKFWAIALLVIAVVVGFLLFRKGRVDFAEQLKKLQDAHDEELKKIQEVRAEEKRQHEENEKKLKSALDTVQKQYDDAKKDLDAKKKKEIEELVKQYGNDPDSLAKKLSEATGFVIILPQQQ